MAASYLHESVHAVGAEESQRSAFEEMVCIIMAGGVGSRMGPLTTDTPKCMLPVANIPLIEYQLQLLKNSKFSRVIVVTTYNWQSHFQRHFEHTQHQDINVELSFVSEDTDTADALRSIADKISTDFVVMSSDLISDVFVHHVADIHRTKDADLTALICPSNITEGKEGDNSKISRMDVGLHDFVGIDNETQRLVYLQSAADVEDDSIVIKRRIMKRHPRISITKSLQDAFFYIFRRWVIDLVVDNESMSSIKEELVPFLISKQYSNTLPKSYPSALHSSSSGHQDLTYDDEEEHADNDNIRCFAYVYKDGVCSRARSLASWKQLNVDIARGALLGVCYYTQPEAEDENQQALQAKAMHDSMGGQGLSFGDKCAIKQSVLGNHVKLGNGVKIAQSVIMDHVTVGDNVSIQNCVIGKSTVICSKSSLKASVTAPKSQIKEGAEIKSEIVEPTAEM